MRLLVDENLPFATVELARAKGIEAVWVREESPKKEPGKCPDESTINETFEMKAPNAELELGGPRPENPIPENPCSRDGCATKPTAVLVAQPSRLHRRLH